MHALAMTAHVDVEKKVSAHRLADGINAKLRPLPIAILAAEEAAEISIPLFGIAAAICPIAQPTGALPGGRPRLRVRWAYSDR